MDSFACRCGRTFEKRVGLRLHVTKRHTWLPKPKSERPEAIISTPLRTAGSPFYPLFKTKRGRVVQILKIGKSEKYGSGEFIKFQPVDGGAIQYHDARYFFKCHEPYST